MGNQLQVWALMDILPNAVFGRARANFPMPPEAGGTGNLARARPRAAFGRMSVKQIHYHAR